MNPLTDRVMLERFANEHPYCLSCKNKDLVIRLVCETNATFREKYLEWYAIQLYGNEKAAILMNL